MSESEPRAGREARTDSEESQTDKLNWDAVGVVASSRYRGLALVALNDSPATPSDIAETADEDIAHVSRAIQELKEHGLVELLVDEDRQKGRYYGVTADGAAVAARSTPPTRMRGWSR
ncbi:winged helix-turn-helix domain-containing protein [Halovenus salina]|uniref:Winged helix-turn-helix domain-containing protein n=1 Tax=Halovenus salina TaxID=1510225 RepID=A0ABD5W0U9_9EURY